MAKLARRPPSARRVILVLAIIGVCLILVGIEHFLGWPDWLTPNRVPAGRIRY